MLIKHNCTEYNVTDLLTHQGKKKLKSEVQNEEVQCTTL